MTDEKNTEVTLPEQDKLACDQTISRKEFLATVLKRATLAGALMIAPQVVDKFLVPPVYALNSTTHFHDTTPHTDTSPFHDQGTNPFQDHGTGTFQDHGTGGFHDTSSESDTNNFHDHGTGGFHDTDSESDTGTFHDNSGTGVFHDSGNERLQRNNRVNDDDHVGDDWG